MTKKEKKWRAMRFLWEEIQSSPENAELSLWDRVELMAYKTGMTAHGIRKFLIRENMYELIIAS